MKNIKVGKLITGQRKITEKKNVRLQAFRQICSKAFPAPSFPTATRWLLAVEIFTRNFQKIAIFFHKCSGMYVCVDDIGSLSELMQPEKLPNKSDIAH